MSDRIKGLTVTLKEDTREDDLQPVIEAIRMVKGVQSVEVSVANPDDHMNRERVRRELQQELFDVLRK